MIGPLSKKGFSTIEYVVVLTIIVGTMFIFKDYIIRGITGRWKAFSDQVGYGRQFHPTDTVECAFDSEFNQGWYDVTCVDNKNCPFENKDCKKAAIAACPGTSYCR
ncbi:MAG: hypothetical protein JNN05_11145 [Candidatus Omnitrophica bacterium]|nr:hypothetical protein [Candidatus Omnitrophota bacterium]